MSNQEKKQVIFIMTDTTRADMLGCYGNKEMKTPNLDALARDGIRYENAYTCQPVCGPARSALFTGLSPHNNGVTTNNLPLGQNVKTIGQYLQDNHIKSGYIGKWHLDAGDYFGYGICPDGYEKDYWYDMKCFLDELSDEDKVKSRKCDTAFEEGFDEKQTYAYRCTQRALSFLEQNVDEDFLLVVSYDEPHGPCLCPAPFNTMYEGFKWPDNPNFEDDLSKKPLMQQLWAKDGLHKSAAELNKPSRNLALFLGCNSFVDHQVGKLLEVINKKYKDALVIFTSDHGDMLGNHRLQMKNAACYKEIANIPLIVKGGAKGAVCKRVASHIDICPTIMDYFGLEVPKIMEGKSMLKQFEDPDLAINEAVFTEFTRYEQDHDGFGGLQMMRAVTTEDYKLVVHLCDTDEFYDLKNDPYEVNNLINDESYAEARNKVHDILLDRMNKTRDSFRGYQWACRPWRKDKQPCWENDGYTRQRDNGNLEPPLRDYDTGLVFTEATRLKTTKDEKN
ncbi:sulfatase-like hydrolase/transferase [uncultured Anaerobiospirillum sp.]|uniref:sulfatase-like hydrolase/transferase n=1 Tax=uncultured Anaerobiospirillum sp. TaxID=265728 RepID=UPI0028052FDE|nr:sulfatase-like hydrolase/transferase [uncultured Anaerobiospirillum sp.]